MTRWSVLVAAISLFGCEATVMFPDGRMSQEAGTPDGRPSEDGPVIADLAPSADLPARVGDPCFGTCARDLLCLVGQCHAPCTPTEDLCNDKTPPCADGERCLKVSDFANACIPSAPVGGACGDEGVYCAGGSFCVDLGGGVKRCLGLCKYGCTGQCVKTITDCEVCVP